MPITPERLRYTAVSGFCVVLNNAIVIGAARLGLHYAAGMCLSFGVLVVVGYAAHAAFTFRSKVSARSFVAYVLACALNFPLAMAAMFLFCSLLRLPVEIGSPLTSGVTFVFNYFGARTAIGQNGRLTRSG